MEKEENDGTPGREEGTRSLFRSTEGNETTGTGVKRKNIGNEVKHKEDGGGIETRGMREETRRSSKESENGPQKRKSRIWPTRNPLVCAQIGCYLSAAGDRGPHKGNRQVGCCATHG